MQNKKRIYGLLIAAFLMLQGGSLSPIWAYTQVTPPSAWQTTPVMSEDVRPNYQFQSTSAYAPMVGTHSYPSSAVYAPASPRPRRSIWDDDLEGEDAIGVFAPVGEPFVLFLMAFLYFIWKKMSKNSKKMQKNLVMSKKSSTFAPAFPK
jgi:hypothetical protein